MSARPVWADYEALAHEIVSELAPFAVVTHNEYIVGHQSEARRQIDITVRWRQADEENLMIVQVKDYKRKADLITVGEFSSVVRDVQAQKGILICSGGFSKGAITYARNTGLLLWSLNDARSKKWKEELTMPVVRHQYVPEFHFSAQLSADVDNTVSGEVQLRVTDDKTGDVTNSPFDVQEVFIERWSSGQLSFEPDVEHRVSLDLDLFVEGFRPDGSTVINRLTHATYVYTVTRSSFLAHLKPSEYRGIKDHLEEDRFLPTNIVLTSPPVNDRNVWTPIPDPARLALTLRGTFFVMKDARIEASTEEITVRVEDLGSIAEQ